MIWPPDVANVPHDQRFDGPWLKWGRAVIHADALQAEIDAAGIDGPDQPTFAVRTEYQPKRHGFAVVIDDIDPAPPTWGLILGDIANNLRSALDQLAWQIVSRGKTPPNTLSEEAQNRIYYPLCKNPRHLTKVLDRKLPGARYLDTQRVRRYQPYKHRAWGYVLPLLADINADDKHRTTQPVWATFLGGTIEVTHRWDCIIRERDALVPRQVLKVDTEIGFVRAQKMGNNPDIEVVPHLTAEPALDGCILLREWMRIALWWVQWLLYEFSEMPPQIERLGIDPRAYEALARWSPLP